MILKKTRSLFLDKSKHFNYSIFYCIMIFKEQNEQIMTFATFCKKVTAVLNLLFFQSYPFLHHLSRVLLLLSLDGKDGA